MQGKKQYANGQATYKLDGEAATYYFKTGKVKAFGPMVDEQMQGEWTFYKESKGDGNQLWQVGNFVDNAKHGNWKRYSKSGELEYDENFNDNVKL